MKKNLIQPLLMLLMLLSSAANAQINGVTLLCKSIEKGDENNNPYTLSINYDLGMATYMSPNKSLSTIFPSTSPLSFHAHTDISTIAITPNLIILEVVSYTKENILSWFSRRIIEIQTNNIATLTKLYGSTPSSPTIKLERCEITSHTRQTQ